MADTPDRPQDEPWDFHIVRVEVNVSAVIQEPSGAILGKNMVDATLAFGWRTEAPPQGISDEAVNAALTRAVSAVLAAVQTSLTFNGWVAMGQVDDPMVKSPASVVGEGRSAPVVVHVDFPDERNAVHD